MPGIAGLISKKSPQMCENIVRRMSQAMMHEPFYSSASYASPELGVYAAAVCHAGSFSDCMPLWNETKDLVILFSGEDYADKNVADSLEKQGHRFTQKDASYLVHLYEEDADLFFRQLNGWFSGIVVDLRNRRAILFNDRFGMERIYYHEDGSDLYFCSEAKALLKIRPQLRQLDVQSLGEYFSCGCTLQNRSLFSGVSLLPGGSAWEFGKNEPVKKQQYFTPDEWEGQSVLETESFYRELRETFGRVLPRYLEPANSLAMSVTGGLDTRLIMASLPSLQSFPCYTFGGIYRDCLDVSIGRDVAGARKFPHEVIRLDREFFRNFSSHAERTVYITDGCHDICGAHDLFYSSAARKIAPVRLTGKFGGEVLRSIVNLKASPPSNMLFDPECYRHILQAGRTLDQIDNGRALTSAVFQAIPWGMHGCLAAERSQLIFRSPFMDNRLVKLLYRAPAQFLSTNEVYFRLIKDNDPTLARMLTDRGFGGTQGKMLSRLYELFYFGLFKVDWYCGVGMPNWMTKLERYGGTFLDAVRGRQRIDHYRIWFREELSGYVRQVLLDPATLRRPFFRKGSLEHIVTSHMSGKANYLSELNKAMTVELIQRLLIETI